MTRLRVYPYKMASKSAKLLSTALGALRIKPMGRYLPRSGDVIVNWGASTFSGRMAPLRSILELPEGVQILNQSDKVANASNKLKTFQILQEAGIPIPEFTTDSFVATDWDKIYQRNVLTGHSGEGIIVREDGFVTNAPLYVKAIENHGEYRVHVFDGDVIDYVKKRKRRGVENNSDIRNLASGWVYTRENLRRLERIEELAIRAVSALGLDFGAVDIIKDENRDVFVLEVNCAPGMSSTTLQSYRTAIQNYVAII